MARHRQKGRTNHGHLRLLLPSADEETFSLAHYAPEVRQAILLALHAAQRQRRCLLCGKPGVKPGVWLPEGLRSPLPDPALRPTAYTLCRAHRDVADATIAAVMTTRH